MPEGLAPKWERLNPAAGFKRLLSMQGVVELLKGLVKMGLVGGISYATLHAAFLSGDLLRTMRMPLPNTLGLVGGLLWTLGLRVSLTLFILAVADFAWQKHQHEKSLKMSASEIKQEMKQSDGDPQMKARIRRLQREMAKRRMMQDVPKADVIITNPTHYAVALQYEDGAGAPKVVAKGQDEIARTIRELAANIKSPLSRTSRSPGPSTPRSRSAASSRLTSTKPSPRCWPSSTAPMAAANAPNLTCFPSDAPHPRRNSVRPRDALDCESAWPAFGEHFVIARASNQ